MFYSRVVVKAKGLRHKRGGPPVGPNEEGATDMNCGCNRKREQLFASLRILGVWGPPMQVHSRNRESLIMDQLVGVFDRLIVAPNHSSRMFLGTIPY